MGSWKKESVPQILEDPFDKQYFIKIYFNNKRLFSPEWQNKLAKHGDLQITGGNSYKKLSGHPDKL